MANSPTTTESNDARPQASTAGAVGYLKDNPNILPQNTALHAAFAKMIESNPALATMSHNDILRAVEQFHENVLLQLECGEDIQPAVAGAARNFLEDHPLVKDQIDIGTLLLLKETLQSYYEQTTYADTNKHLRHDPWEVERRRQSDLVKAENFAQSLIERQASLSLEDVEHAAKELGINPKTLEDKLIEKGLIDDAQASQETTQQANWTIGGMTGPGMSSI